MPKITTLLTSFNRLEMLEEAIRSVQHNTFTDWQLIIGDSSTLEDQRVKIKDYCEKLASEDPRIIFFQYRFWSEEERKRKCEFANKLNKMAKHATGEYITYLNDDDLYASDYYQAYLDVFESVPEAKVAYTGQKAYMANPEDPDKPLFQYSIPAKDIKRCMFFCVDQNCVCHKRELLKEVGGWCDDWWVNGYADAEFWFRLASAGHVAYPTGKFTSLKTIHPNRISAGAEIPYDKAMSKTPTNVMKGE